MEGWVKGNSCCVVSMKFGDTVHCSDVRNSNVLNQLVGLREITSSKLSGN